MSQAATSVDIPEVQLTLKSNLSSDFASILKERETLAWKQYGLNYEVSRKDAMSLFTSLRNSAQYRFDMLVDVTAVDWMDQRPQRYEVIYHLLSTIHYHRLCIRICVSEDNAEVDSVLPLWSSANFMEREVWDMFGITFAGHGDLRRILMYDEFVGHPLRKDYPVLGKQPRVKLRIPEQRNTSTDMQREQLVALPVRQRLNPSAMSASSLSGTSATHPGKPHQVPNKVPNKVTEEK